MVFILRNYPRLAINLVLIVLFSLFHLGYSHWLNTRWMASRNQLIQNGFPMTRPFSVPPIPAYDAQNPYYQALERYKNASSRAQFKLKSDAYGVVSPDGNARAHAEEIRKLLHKARIDNDGKFVGYPLYENVMLIKADLTNARLAFESGDNEAGAEILLDVLALYRMVVQDPNLLCEYQNKTQSVWPGLFTYESEIPGAIDDPLNSITASARLLGLGLKPHDPAADLVKKLAGEFANDAYAQGAYRHYVAQQLLKAEDCFELELLSPTIRKYYASAADSAVVNHAKIQAGYFNLPTLKAFDLHNALIFHPANSDPRYGYEYVLNNDLTTNHLTAIGLACRLYHADRGEWPRYFQDLAPDYIPVLPRFSYRPRETLHLMRLNYTHAGVERVVLVVGHAAEVNKETFYTNNHWQNLNDNTFSNQVNLSGNLLCDLKDLPDGFSEWPLSSMPGSNDPVKIIIKTQAVIRQP